MNTDFQIFDRKYYDGWSVSYQTLYYLKNLTHLAGKHQKHQIFPLLKFPTSYMVIILLFHFDR